MKKIFFSAMAAMVICCMACNISADATLGKSEMAQKNIAASDKVAKAFETCDVSALDSVIADDFVDHTDRGDMIGRDSLKAMVQYMQANFKDMKTEKVHELADDEYVYSRMRYTGTTDGSAGMPAGPYDMKAIEVTKFKDGKAIEHWAFMEVQEMMKMMAPPTPAMADSAKK